MARQNHGPLSRATGKLGGVVYQQYEGIQVSREYQPNVKNPQSEKQVENRAKFKLASQTVGIFKEIVNVRLAKFSIYTRIRRGAAVEALKRRATWESDRNSELVMADAIAALNAKSLTEYSAPTLTVANSAFQVTAPADAEIIGVVAGFDSEGVYIGRKVVSATGTGSATSFAIPSEYDNAKAMFVYTVAQTEEGRSLYDNIIDPGSSFYIETERLINSGDIAVSDIAGETFTRS